jgi:hypothetical protein
MYKKLLMLVFIPVLSVGVSAESLELTIDKNIDYNDPLGMDAYNFKPQFKGNFENSDVDRGEKSVLPVVLSASFLFMSLYGDNSNSSMYRVVGVAATVVSFSWYFD